MKSLLKNANLRIIFIYVITSCLWIFFSDRWLAIFFPDPATLTIIQTYKGWFFVAASAALLYYLLSREVKRQSRIQEALKVSQQGSLKLFSSNPIPMWVSDLETQQILAANDAALALYGYTRPEFTRLTIDQLIHEPTPDSLDRTRMDSPDLQIHRTQDGRAIYVHIFTHLLDFNGRPARLASVEDITDRKQMELAYQASELNRIEAETSYRLDESRLNALLRLSQISRDSVSDTENLVLEETTRLTHSEYSFLAVVNGPSVDVLVSPSLPGEDNRFQLRLEDLPAGNVLKQAHDTGQVVTSVDSDGVLVGILPVGINTSHVAVPFFNGEQVTAVAGASGRAGPYSEADLRQLSLLVGGLWQLIQQSRMLEALDESQMRLTAAVENLPFDFWIQDQEGRFILQNQPSREAWGSLIGKNLDEDNLDQGVVEIWKAAVEKASSGRLVRAEITYPDRIEKGTYYNIVAPIWDGEEIRGTLGMNISIAALKQRERELATLVSIASAMRSAASQAEMRTSILEQVMDLLQIEAAALVSQEKLGENLRIELARGAWSESTGMQMPFPTPEAEEIFRAGEIHWNSQIAGDPLLSVCPLFQQMESGACIPLKTRGGVQHALWVGSVTALTMDQIHLLEAISDIAGSAIHRAELNEQTERHLQRMTALRAIDMAITSSLDVRLTLNILLSQIISQLNIDAAGVLLYSTHTRHLEAAANRGFSGDGMQTASHYKGASLAAAAVQRREQIFIPDLNAADANILAEFRKGGDEFCSYIAQPLIAKGQVKGVLEIYQRSILKPSDDWLDFLEAVSSQAAIAIDNAEMFDTLQRANTDLTVAYDATIEGWSRALELRDRETQGHTTRVTNLTVTLAESLGIKETNLVNIRRGVLLHDIGKMAIPDRILHKPGPLTTEEWEIMRRHPQYAQEMLSSIPYLRDSIDIPYCHHERWDGSGYPRGIKNGQIPLAARLFAVVDIWDALTSDRPYRKAWPKEKVLTYLHEQAGKRLDPELVDFFIKNVNELAQV